MTESHPAYRFSPANLGTVLYALHPRPRILVTGTAVDGEIVESIESVWREYVKKVGEEEGEGEGRCCWVVVGF